MSQIQGPVLLEIPSDPSALFLVRCLVERLAQRMAFGVEEVAQLTLAVDEACTNAIRHAYGNRLGERIVLRFMVKKESLEIQVRDFGDPVDPSTIRPRELGDIRPGGLGTHFIRSAMDEVSYEAQEGGGTMLRLVKYRKSSGGQGR